MKFDIVTGVYKIICRHQRRTVTSELRNGVPYNVGHLDASVSSFDHCLVLSKWYVRNFLYNNKSTVTTHVNTLKEWNIISFITLYQYQIY